MTNPLPRRHVVIFTAVLVAEALVVSLLVDVQPLLFAWGLSHLRLFFALPFVVVVAHLILDRAARQKGPTVPIHSRWRVFVFGHALLLGAFMRVTRWATISPAEVEPLVVAGWFLLGLASVVSLAVTVFSWSAIVRAMKGAGRSLFAAAALGAAAFAAALLTERAWPLLQRGTLHAVAATLDLFMAGTALDIEAAVVGAGDFFVTIDHACSGGEGIGLMLVLVAGYVAMRRSILQWPNTWILLPLAVLLAAFTNVFRIVALIIIGAKVSPEMALAGFHSKAGWVLACALAFGLTSFAERRLVVTPNTTQHSDPAPVYLGPLLVALAATLVSGLFVVDIDYTYPIRTVIVAAALIPFFRTRGFERPGVVMPTIVGLVVFVVWFALARAPDAAVTAANVASLEASGGASKWIWIAARVVGSVAVVPIVEELAFRGFIMRRFVHHDFDTVPYDATTIVAAMGSSLIFGALHSSFLAGVLAGMGYAFVAFRSGRLSDAVVAHGVTNGAIAAAVLLGDQWWLWL